MAIIFEAKQTKINWQRWITVLFIIGFFSATIYYLFFSATPKFEVILPIELKEAEIIANSQYIDPSAVFKNKNLEKLQNFASKPSLGLNGRENPFIPF
ncbi:MAG: hypothetical protein EXS49_02400 [Candidatus Pacebacteria bacterium]|nr:hypothetical protein [Candidatus Paceibacterota bacterium]